MSPVLESPDLLQCHSPVAAGQIWDRAPCLSFKGPSSSQSCTSIKARSPEQCRNISGSFCTSCCSKALEETHGSDLCVVYPKVQSSGPRSGHAVLPGPGPFRAACASLAGRDLCCLIGILLSPRGCGWLPHPLDACNAQHVPLQYHTACDLSCWPADMDCAPLGVLSAVLSSGLFFKIQLSV